MQRYTERSNSVAKDIYTSMSETKNNRNEIKAKPSKEWQQNEMITNMGTPKR